MTFSFVEEIVSICYQGAIPEIPLASIEKIRSAICVFGHGLSIIINGINVCPSVE